MDQFCPLDKIKDLLVKGIVTSDTRLVLVNAIYFKGKWNKQFKEQDTKDAPFYITKVTVLKQRTQMENNNQTQILSCFSSGYLL